MVGGVLRHPEVLKSEFFSALGDPAQLCDIDQVRQ